MTKFRNMWRKLINSRIKISFIVFLLPGLASNNALGLDVSQNEYSSCPSQWSAVVSRVKQKFAARHDLGAHTTVFVGTDGKVFNCLSEDLSPMQLSQIQRIEVSKSKILSEIVENGIPFNYCTVARTEGVDNLVDYYVYIPQDIENLHSELCVDILEKSIDFFW